MAYILGFFCADGAMTVNPRGSKYIDFTITDLDLLEKIKECLGSNHKIKMRRAGNGPRKTQYRLQIGSKIIFADLIGLGITTKKTFRFNLPKVPKKYFHDFVRGYFDGDGNIWSGLTNKQRKTPSPTLRAVFTSGNHKFLEQLAEHLKKEAGVIGFINFHSRAHRLNYSSIASLSLYKFMYNGANVFLSRKRAVFERYLTNKNGPVV